MFNVGVPKAKMASWVRAARSNVHWPHTCQKVLPSSAAFCNTLVLSVHQVAARGVHHNYIALPDKNAAKTVQFEFMAVNVPNHRSSTSYGIPAYHKHCLDVYRNTASHRFNMDLL